MKKIKLNGLSKLKSVVERFEEESKTHEHKVEMTSCFKSNPTSFQNWYPLIKDLVKTPRSIWYDVDYSDYLDSIDGVMSYRIREIAKHFQEWAKVNRFEKIFIKNYVFSGKHDFANCCLVNPSNEDEIMKHMRAINDMSSCVAGEPGLGFVARELIDTSYSPFLAFDTMPVVAERRYLTKGSEVPGFLPYWIPKAIENETDFKEWREELNKLNYSSQEEMKYLKGQTKIIADVLQHLGSGNWAIDWLRDSNGEWWCIDIQEAEKSAIFIEEITYLGGKNG